MRKRWKAPRRKVDIQAAGDEFVAVAAISSWTKQVDQVVLGTGQFARGQSEVALGLVRGVARPAGPRQGLPFSQTVPFLKNGHSGRARD
jgi:hypothetical protein